MHKTHRGMGFKDLTIFNLAMIGKQGWKFMPEPNSLVSRIFKARYFPNSNHLNANLGHNRSYVWRSILKARFIVCGGARWCIQGRSPSYGKASLGYPKNKIILEVVGMYIYPATPNNKY